MAYVFGEVVKPIIEFILRIQTVEANKALATTMSKIMLGPLEARSQVLLLQGLGAVAKSARYGSFQQHS